MIRSQSRSCQLLVPGMINAVTRFETLVLMMVGPRNDGKAYAEGLHVKTYAAIPADIAEEFAHFGLCYVSGRC